MTSITLYHTFNSISKKKNTEVSLNKFYFSLTRVLPLERCDSQILADLLLQHIVLSCVIWRPLVLCQVLCWEICWAETDNSGWGFKKSLKEESSEVFLYEQGESDSKDGMYITREQQKKVGPQVIKTAFNKSWQCNFTAPCHISREPTQGLDLRCRSFESCLLNPFSFSWEAGCHHWTPLLLHPPTAEKKSKAQFTLVMAVTVSPSDLTNHITVFILQIIFIFTQPTDDKWLFLQLHKFTYILNWKDIHIKNQSCVMQESQLIFKLLLLNFGSHTHVKKIIPHSGHPQHHLSAFIE